MSITDELREFAREHQPYKSELYNAQVCDHLCAIADRIDAEHEHAIGHVNDYDPETMDEHGWVKLPLDADEVPIRVGDELEFCGRRITVIGIGNVTVDEDSMGVFAHHGNGEYEWFNAEFCRHVQPDSQERIIEDGLRLVADNIARRTEMEYGEVLKQDAFYALMDGFNLGRARGYDDGFKAHLSDLEARVERIERLLNHKGAE